MELEEFITPEVISGAVGGLMIVVALLFARGVAWLKALVMSTPTKIDDRFYNGLVKAFGDAGVIPPEQADAVSVAKPKSGGLKLRAAPLATLGAVALLGLSLPGCTASDIATARQLTVADGAAFVAENHARRQEVRRELYAFEDEVIAKCKDWARAAQFDDDIAEARIRIEVCLDFLEESYPDLATIELLREGSAALNALRREIRPAQ